MSNTPQAKRGFFRNAFDSWVAARERQAERYVRSMQWRIDQVSDRTDK